MKASFLSVVAVGLTGLAEAAMAQTGPVPVGTVSATIGDMAYEGETLDVPSEGTSTAEWRAFGPVTSVSVQAHDPAAESLMHGVLTIEMSLMGEDASAGMMDASVSWWPEGMSAPFYINEVIGPDLGIAIDTLSLEEGGSKITGTFSARLCRKDSFFAEIDSGDCVPVEGRFDTALTTVD
ncbi:hypothetical protein GI582_05215 [Sulfitobacter sp. BDSS02]|nr:hypothetical protein [Sulfitobacter sp. BDSS02]MBR9848445.1 hypothetical protein [Paracoccaceae bacterium]